MPIHSLISHRRRRRRHPGAGAGAAAHAPGGFCVDGCRRAGAIVVVSPSSRRRRRLIRRSWRRWRRRRGGGGGGESFLRVDWVAVPEALRARRVNRGGGAWRARHPSSCRRWCPSSCEVGRRQQSTAASRRHASRHRTEAVTAITLHLCASDELRSSDCDYPTFMCER
eukprot:COSAG01_NODE_174_length_23022_cov_528.590978_12_plen_168_part_00